MLPKSPKLKVDARRFPLGGFILLITFSLCSSIPIHAAPLNESMRGLMKDYCISCHNPDKKKGKLDLESILEVDMGQHFEIWDEVSWMLEEREMPPEDAPDEPRPSEAEFEQGAEWLAEALKSLKPEGHSAIAISSKLAVVDKYCISCHNAEDKKGDMNLEDIRFDDVLEHSETWENVITRLKSRQMPPADRKRPNDETYEAVLANLTETLDAAAAKNPNAGRTDTFRRLNRTEYQNSIRDLLGVEIDAGTLLPKDEESHGFDNVTVGTLSPSLLDRYISAAQKISRLAVGAPNDILSGDTFRTPADHTQEKHVAGLPLGTRGGVLIPYTFPQDGEYEIEVRLTRDRNEHVEGLNESHEMEILLDKETLQRFTIERPRGRRDHSKVDKHLTMRTEVTAGPHDLGVTFLKNPNSISQNRRQPFESHFNYHRHPRLSPAVYQVSITGPFNGKGASNTPSRDKIFIEYPENAGEEDMVAKVILGNLMKRAYRRTISEQDLERPFSFYKDEAEANGFEAGIETALSSILVNPEFIFRIERDPKRAKPGQAYKISDLELANRLSFFLWSSIPDEELLEEAIAGNLSTPKVLEEQTLRMLSDPRSSNLVNNFAGQWLHLRNLEAIVPDLRLYPDFDDNLRKAFRKETELFIESILREDKSVVDILKSDYTYLNERLAHHYGIPNVFGSRFRRVELDPKYHRGGLLRQGSVLTVTSFATRTSPVIRGNWILENIIGTPTKPPPDDVPALEENSVDATLPMRERLAQHSSNPACASCHVLMDPPGFALENFDAIGQWREFENGAPVDATGGLPDGRTFDGVGSLEEGLLQRPELFVRTFSRKLLTFALGRGVEVYDAPAVRKIVKEAEEENYRFSSVILEIVNSVPFQMRTKLEEEFAPTQP